MQKTKMKMPLKGIYGGNNFKYINDHAHEVIKLVQNDENLKHFELSDSNKILANTHQFMIIGILVLKLI